MLSRRITGIVLGAAAAALVASAVSPSVAVDASSSAPALTAGKANKGKITLNGPKNDPALGDKVKVKGKATLKKQPIVEAKVKLQRKKSKKWVDVAKTKTNKKGKYDKKITLPNKSTVKVRAKLVKPTRGKCVTSQTLTVSSPNHRHPTARTFQSMEPR